MQGGKRAAEGSGAVGHLAEKRNTIESGYLLLYYRIKASKRLMLKAHRAQSETLRSAISAMTAHLAAWR